MAGSAKQSQIVNELCECLQHSLSLEIIYAVASECNFDPNKSLNVLLEMASGIDKNAVQQSKKRFPQSASEHNLGNKSRKAQNVDRIIKDILKGYKVLILMRGIPGSGKSYLAHQIVDATLGPGDNSAHILSTDDFFMKKGRYVYQPEFISEAHNWNHQRAFEAMSRGLSPVVIDNTNSQMWEMKPYATMAIDYGYYLEVLEPDTHWAQNWKELHKRNVHGLPKDKIRSMIERYEKNITAQKLLCAYNLKYKHVKPPQFRSIPPLTRKRGAPSNNTNLKSASMFALNAASKAKQQSPVKTKYETINMIDFSEDVKMPSAANNDQPIVIDSDSSSVDDILMCSDNNTETVLQPEIKVENVFNAWGIKAEALETWEAVVPLKIEKIKSEISTNETDTQQAEIVQKMDCSSFIEPFDLKLATNPTNHDLLVPGNYKILTARGRDINDGVANPPYKILKKMMVDKSSLTDKVDDGKNLKALKDLFPKIPHSYLNDIFNKCHRDFDYTVDVLLEDNETVYDITDEQQSSTESEDEEEPTVEMEQVQESVDESKGAIPRPKVYINEEAVQLKRKLEEKVHISDAHYSPHLLKVKNYQLAGTSANKTPELQDDQESEDEDDIILIEDDDNPKNLVDLNLGDGFVSQLEQLFGGGDNGFPKGFQPLVQMPMALAQQIYCLYVESIYDQLDAQNAILKELEREDEEFAKKLQKEEDESVVIIAEAQSPPSITLGDIIQEQMTERKTKEQSNAWKSITADNLAAKLTRRKLCDSFPSIDNHALLDVLHAYGNDYNQTVEVLKASTGLTPVNTDHIKTISPEVLEDMKRAETSAARDLIDNAVGENSAMYYRDEADRHIQKRNEYYNQAQKYHGSGMREVAMYYAELAKKETQLSNKANSLAALEFVQGHCQRLQDFHTLDLHFLRIDEALTNLDIFIDRNIHLLQGGKQKSQELIVITGRGKHSPGGKSRLIPAFLGRLKKRHLTAVKLNPGAFKFTVHRTSLVTNDVN